MGNKEYKIKCVVWDLDHTLWNGVLTEDESVSVRPEALELLQILDERGILQSIASKNNEDQAMEKLQKLGLAHYFVYPQIHWNPKSQSIAQIAKEINIGIDTLAFLDDQPFEREEVAFTHPQVLTLDSADLLSVKDLDCMIPRFITEDSKKRREMIQSDIRRKDVEETFEGSQDQFLSTLGLKLEIKKARIEDLKRAEELTQRTNQLNTTGYTYDYDELAHFSASDEYLLLVAGLEDKYGTYGKIGLVLLDKGEEVWRVRLLLMSCRVMSRGVGGVLITYIRNLAKEAGVRLEAEFVHNDRNRMMYMTYKFNQFSEKEQNDQWVLFENDLTKIPPYPEFMQLEIEN